MPHEEVVTTVIEEENTPAGKAELLRQLEELLDMNGDKTKAADERAPLTLRIFSRKC